MRAAVLSLMCATALAMPSALKHHHVHQHHARDLVVKTVVVTKMVTETWSPSAEPTVEAQHVRAGDVHADEDDEEDDTPAPVYGDDDSSPPTYNTAPQVPADDDDTDDEVDEPEDDEKTEPPPPKIEHKKKPAPDAQKPKVEKPHVEKPHVEKPQAEKPKAEKPKYGGAPSKEVPADSDDTPKDDGDSYGGGKIKGKNMVIFGDNLSDRGNGSVDHNVDGGDSDIYTYRTWTNGKIAAEVLADNLNIPIKYDYAFGHSDGGSNFGATVDNEFTQSNSNAPSCADQIKNYTSNGAYYDKSTVGESIHFLWCGNNDVLPWAMPTANSVVKCNTSHIFTGPDVEEGNKKFAHELAMIISVQVQKLLNAGAKNIFVPNIYPRHIAPVVGTYFTAIAKGAGQVDQYGDAIIAANTELKRLLQDMQKKSGANIVYYDAFKYLLDLYNNRAAHGFTHGNNAPEDICDDGKDMDKLFNCSPKIGKEKYIGDDFYWMEYLDMSAKVHRMLADDMANAVNAAGF